MLILEVVQGYQIVPSLQILQPKFLKYPPTLTCPVYKTGVEDIQYIFLLCSIASHFWEELGIVRTIQPPYIVSTG